jgi:uncharacterized protein YjbI with pentapeptide repeats
VSSFRSRARRSLSNNPYIGETVKGDFRNGLAEQCAFNEMKFEDCHFEQASFFRSIFAKCSFRECNLSLVNFNACSFKDSEFHDCTLDQAQFKSATLDTVSFIGGRAEYVSFEGAAVKDLLLDLQLHGADLRWHGANNVDYGMSNLWGATVKVGCKQFVGAKLDARSLEMFIGLLAKTRGNNELRGRLKSMISPRISEMVDRLTLTGVEE